MAVEAHHLHLFPSQLLKNRAIADAAENRSNLFDPHTGLVAPSSSSAAAAAAAASYVPFYNPAAAAAAESGLTFNNFAAASAAAILSRKRPRDSTPPVSFLGEDISALVHHQMLDVDRLILYHAAKVRAELIERRGRFARQVLAAAEEGLAKRLKAKEEEMERMTKLNWALEEKVKSLCVENQIWRDLAQSNEAAANVLRTNLEQVLAAQSRIKPHENDDAAAAAAEDAESCCCGGNYASDADADADAEEARNQRASRQRRACRSCGEGEPTVLILPCRHLCLCAMCAPAVDACPVCKSAKNGSMSVNMS
uniref:RING-type domain-containing protein n=1 Tax=Ananas comosus var. bracteatus TaxID=296719 RepID=A0A6V7QF46_ANACO|nr:unnamed protein product [Ananas comosus var. bracteatus]